MEIMACVIGSDCDLWHPLQKNDQLAFMLEYLQVMITSSFKMFDDLKLCIHPSPRS